jgi:hypothetical protein
MRKNLLKLQFIPIDISIDDDYCFRLSFDYSFRQILSPILRPSFPARHLAYYHSYRDYTNIFCDERTGVRDAGLNAGDDYVESF